MIIYKITNNINGKAYVGQTKRPLKIRWQAHCNGRGSLFHDAIKEFGKNNFSIEVIEETEHPDERETYWVEYFDTYNNGYNSTPDGKYHGKNYDIKPEEMKRRQTKAKITRMNKRVVPEWQYLEKEEYISPIPLSIQDPTIRRMTIEELEQEVLKKEMEEMRYSINF